VKPDPTLPDVVEAFKSSRNFNLSTDTRRDLMGLGEECEKVKGLLTQVDEPRLS
jgi:hypothetical protein